MQNTPIAGITLIAIAFGFAGYFFWDSIEDRGAYSDKLPGGNVTAEDLHNMPVPEAVAAVRAKVAQEEGVTEGEVIILTAYERQWPDSCLGLARQSEACAQVITAGFEVTTKAKGKERVFHTNQSGSVIR